MSVDEPDSVEPELEEPTSAAAIEFKFGPAEVTVHSRGLSSRDHRALMATFVVIVAAALFGGLAWAGHPVAGSVALVVLLVAAVILARRPRRRP